MELTITAKLKIKPSEHEQTWLKQTTLAYKKGCNYVSEIVFRTKNLKQASLHQLTYATLRDRFDLRSQMAQSVMKTVIAKYKTLEGNKHDWTQVQFKKPEYDLVWNRDYSLVKGLLSVNTLNGRIKVPFETKGMEHFFQDGWSFGTAKLVNKHLKWFLHIPMTKDFAEADLKAVKQVVGIDLGINFLATSYDSQGKTSFFKGRTIKHKRAKYKQLRKTLQMRQTPSARKRLKAIGSRETRWMTDVNHRISKALVSRYGAKTLFVLEDLTGLRNATEKVRVKDRYTSVSWAFYQFRQMLEYKAQLVGATVVAVSPKYTSQTCPKCGHTEKTNRNKKLHRFQCKTCGYQSNDDRIGAMNLHRKGIEYLEQNTVSA